MYREIRKDILDIMYRYGIVSTIYMSVDVYNELSESQVQDLKSYLDVRSVFKIVILTTIDSHYHFGYTRKPDRDDKKI